MKTKHIPDTLTIKIDKYKSFIFYDENNIQRCGARRRGTQLPCKWKPKKGNARCTRYHSGDTPKGIANQNFKHGNDSGYKDLFPQQLSKIYQDSLNDIDLLDIGKRVAILDVRLKQLIEQTEDGDYGTLYSQIMKRAYETSGKLENYKRGKKELVFMEFEDYFEDLMLLIQSGQTQYQTWQEIRGIVSDIKSLIKTQSDVELQGEKAVSIRELNDFMVLLLGVIKQANLEKEQLRFISDGVMTIMNIEAKVIEDENNI